MFLSHSKLEFPTAFPKKRELATLNLLPAHRTDDASTELDEWLVYLVDSTIGLLSVPTMQKGNRTGFSIGKITLFRMAS